MCTLAPGGGGCEVHMRFYVVKKSKEQGRGSNKMGGLLMKVLQKAACTVNNRHAGNTKGGLDQ